MDAETLSTIILLGSFLLMVFLHIEEFFVPQTEKKEVQA